MQVGASPTDRTPADDPAPAWTGAFPEVPVAASDWRTSIPREFVARTPVGGPDPGRRDAPNGRRHTRDRRRRPDRGLRRARLGRRRRRASPGRAVPRLGSRWCVRRHRPRRGRRYVRPAGASGKARRPGVRRLPPRSGPADTGARPTDAYGAGRPATTVPAPAPATPTGPRSRRRRLHRHPPGRRVRRPGHGRRGVHRPRRGQPGRAGHPARPWRHAGRGAGGARGRDARLPHAGPVRAAPARSRTGTCAAFDAPERSGQANRIDRGQPLDGLDRTRLGRAPRPGRAPGPGRPPRAQRADRPGRPRRAGGTGRAGGTHRPRRPARARLRSPLPGGPGGNPTRHGAPGRPAGASTPGSQGTPVATNTAPRVNGLNGLHGGDDDRHHRRRAGPRRGRPGHQQRPAPGRGDRPLERARPRDRPGRGRHAGRQARPLREPEPPAAGGRGAGAHNLPDAPRPGGEGGSTGGRPA